MSEAYPKYDDEIDLYDLFKTLWDGKWKILVTTFFSAAIGFVYSVSKPNYFEVTTPIKNADRSIFLPYTTLNSLLKNKGFHSNKELNNYGFVFNSESIFNAFIAEFNDYKEMVNVLSEDEFVKQSIKDLDYSDKKKALIEFAKEFEIVPPLNKKENENWLLKFKWHNDYEGRRLFSDAIQKTLINIQKIKKNNIYDLVKVVETENSFQLEKLQVDLKSIKRVEKDLLKNRVIFLYEQYAIANQLGIETNKLDTKVMQSLKLSMNSLSQNPQNQTLVSINPNEPYYLRGSKAIKKEIELIEGRNEEDISLMSDDYQKVKKEITFLQNDNLSTQLKVIANLVEDDNARDWVEFDMQLADSKSLNRPMLYNALSIALGLMVGVINVLISNAIRKRKGQSAKA